MRDRLQAMLETRQGKLGEIVELEKSLSQTQQELDAATALLAELRTRLDMSKVEIAYHSELPMVNGGNNRPIASAFASVGDVFAESVGFLIRALVALLPFVVVFGEIVAAGRAVRRRRRRAPV